MIGFVAGFTCGGVFVALLTIFTAELDTWIFYKLWCTRSGATPHRTARSAHARRAEGAVPVIIDIDKNKRLCAHCKKPIRPGQLIWDVPGPDGQKHEVHASCMDQGAKK